jgi:hypothetical protein
MPEAILPFPFRPLLFMPVKLIYELELLCRNVIFSSFVTSFGTINVPPIIQTIVL